MMDYVKLIRVRHYIKNLLVFVALACGGELFNFRKLLKAFIAFAVFCMVSSAVYIVNDIKDKDKDRKHSIKRYRPIAAGRISVRNAWVLSAIFLLFAVLCNCLIFSKAASLVLALYLILNLAYSFGLKDIPLLDVAILVSGFLLRILYGAIITEITISNWLYLTTVSMAFYFAFGKRRNELRQDRGGENSRRVLEFYPFSFLDKNMGMCLTLANVFYALWSMDERTAAVYDNKGLIFTVPIVLLITMKYSLDIEGDSDGDPVEVLLHDKALLVLVLGYLTIMIAILYL